MAEAEAEFQPCNGKNPRNHCGNQLVRPRHFVLKILEVDQVCVELELQAFHHTPTGQYMTDAALADALVHDFAAGRII